MVRRLATRAAATLSAVALSIGIVTATSAAAATAGVTISSSGCGSSFFCYKPSPLSVADGTVVKWTDTTGVAHTVTRCTVAACGSGGAGSGSGTFTNGTIAPNGTLSRTLSGTGTYNYFCTIHGYAIMHGSVVVRAPK